MGQGSYDCEFSCQLIRQHSCCSIPMRSDALSGMPLAAHTCHDACCKDPNSCVFANTSSIFFGQKLRQDDALLIDPPQGWVTVPPAFHVVHTCDTVRLGWVHCRNLVPQTCMLMWVHIHRATGQKREPDHLAFISLAHFLQEPAKLAPARVSWYVNIL